DLEAPHAPAQRRLAVRLDERVNVLALDRHVNDPHALERRGHVRRVPQRLGRGGTTASARRTVPGVLGSEHNFTTCRSYDPPTCTVTSADRPGRIVTSGGAVHVIFT